MCSEEKARMKLIIKNFEEKLSKKQQEWVWFIGLWLLGFSSVGLLAYAIRLIMGIE